MATPTTELELVTENKWEEGIQKIYKHFSKSTNCEMKFSIFIPASSNPSEKFQVLMFLTGAFTNEHDFLNKSNFQSHASEFRFAVVCPDSGPKAGVHIPPEKSCQWLGKSASWYIDAVKEPWSKNFQMYSYISKELPELVETHFPVHPKFGICGFSMGGNAAIFAGLRDPDRFLSISCFAPNCNPSCVGADSVFAPLLGYENKETLWNLYDACEVAKRYDGPFRDILVEQGAEDEYFKSDYLQTGLLLDIVDEHRHLDRNFRFREGEGHSVDIVAKFWRGHFEHHSEEFAEFTAGQV